HHGSNTSSSLPFLEAVDPGIAIWPAGANNSSGHPHQATLTRLAQLGVEVHGTAEEGTILVCTDGQQYRVGDCAFDAPEFGFQLLMPGVRNDPLPTAPSPSPTPSSTPTVTEQPSGPTATFT